jgi:hypothetical protein
MFHKSSFVSPIAVASLLLSAYLLHSSLAAQSSATVLPSSIPPASTEETSSNLISNNPFVPQKNSTLNQPKGPAGPKTSINKPQVLQKYLQFKSIAIINKKKYFSIFNKRTNKSFWISENETVENFRVTNYNQVSNTITITDGINTEIITIITANEAPINVASASVQPNNQEAVAPAIPGATPTQQNNKPKNPPRRRVIPVKR